MKLMSGHRKIGTFLRGLFCAFAILCASIGAAIGAGEGPWRVTAIEGEAAATLPTRAPQALRLGDAIEPGSEIATEAGSHVTLTRGKTSMTLSPESRTKIPFDSDQGQRTSIFQRFGSLLLKVDKRPEQHFEVQTPFLAAVVKGTVFTVEVGGNGAAVHVSEGAVEVGALASGQVELVRPGQTATVGQGPNAGLELRDGGSRQSRQGRPDEAPSDQSGRVEPTQDGDALTRLSAAPAGPVTGFKITRTMGLDSLDISTLTDGLVAPFQPRVEAPGLLGTRATEGRGQSVVTAGTKAVGAGKTPTLSAEVDALTVPSPGLSSRPASAAGGARPVGAVAPRLADTASGLVSASPSLTSSKPDVGRLVRDVINPGLGGATGQGPAGGSLLGGNGQGDDGADN